MAKKWMNNGVVKAQGFDNCQRSGRLGFNPRSEQIFDPIVWLKI